MARSIRLKKGFLFMTLPEQRIKLSQQHPQCELPSALRPNELEQIKRAIDSGMIEEAGSTKSNEAPKEPSEEETVDEDEEAVLKLLNQSVSKVKTDLVAFINEKSRRECKPLWIRNIVEYEEKGKNRSSLIDFLQEYLNKLSGVDSIEESEQQEVKISFGEDYEPTDSNIDNTE
jgi:hypothetical protein